MHPRPSDPVEFRRIRGIVSATPIENLKSNVSATREPRDPSNVYRKRRLPDCDLQSNVSHSTSSKKRKKTPESVIIPTGPVVISLLLYLVSKIVSITHSDRVLQLDQLNLPTSWDPSRNLHFHRREFQRNRDLVLFISFLSLKSTTSCIDE